MAFWPLINRIFPTDQTFHQFHDVYTELDLHRIMSGFHGGRSVGETKATQLVWLTGLRAHLNTNRNSRVIKRTHIWKFVLDFNIVILP